MDLGHGALTRMVERAAAALPTRFRFADVVERCPLVVPTTVGTVLGRMAREGKVASEGKGRYATWRRLA